MVIYQILLLGSALVILSYIFNYLSNRTKIPSVVFLLATGIALHYLFQGYLYTTETLSIPLKFLGTLGIIFIVLEGSLDLKITKDNIKNIVRAFFSASIILLLTWIIAATLLIHFTSILIFPALVYALPLAIVSSAIAIPSVNNLAPDKKSFIIYESTFSDIIGILIFGYLVSGNAGSFRIIGDVFFDIIITLILSAITCVSLIMLIHITKTDLKIFMPIAFVVGAYALAKMYHLPALMLILFSGLLLNNLGKLKKYISLNWLNEHFDNSAHIFKHLITELSFFIRTFFFILFGYTLDFSLLINPNVLLIGFFILLAILVIRYLALKYVLKISTFPELFVAPRGLVTVILFYSIPVSIRQGAVGEGVIYFVVLATSIMLAFGLILNRNRFVEEPKLFFGN